MSKSYNAESIQVLEDMEHLRLRPAMYIGSQDSEGVRHILKECFDNSVDEFLAGHATFVEVEINTIDHSFRVLDDGRGIPVETHSKTGVSTLITVFTNLQAGAKFEKASYALSAGLHGVGLKATNALSEWLLARVWREGRCYEQRFARGIAQSSEPTPNKTLNKRGRTGTEVSFVPDTEIFSDSRIDVDKVKVWLDQSSHLCPGLKIRLIVDGDSTEYLSTGLANLVQLRAGEFPIMHSAPLSLESKDKHISASFLWTEAEGENWFSACNASATPEGGKHVEGALKAITDAIAPYTKKDVEVRDLVDGLFAAIHVLVSEPKFKSQTKEKLLNAETKDEVYACLYPQLKSFFDQNKKLAEKLVSRALQLKKARESYKKLRSVINQPSARKDRGVLPDKLVEAMHCSPENRELFIVEGDSAGGSAKIARDPTYQEVLPLKGKVPNATQTSLAKLLGNTELSATLIAIGIQMGPKGEADLSNIRVGKVLLLMDADPDGQHITSLLLAFFCTWMPDLVKKGYIYIVDSPLFIGVHKDQRWYTHSLKELEEVSGFPANKLQVSRLKGHGEVSSTELKHYAMNPGSRRLWKVSMDSTDQGIMLSLMGQDSSTRKILLGLT